MLLLVKQVVEQFERNKQNNWKKMPRAAKYEYNSTAISPPLTRTQPRRVARPPPSTRKKHEVWWHDARCSDSQRLRGPRDRSCGCSLLQRKPHRRELGWGIARHRAGQAVDRLPNKHPQVASATNPTTYLCFIHADLNKSIAEVPTCTTRYKVRLNVYEKIPKETFQQ